jgi:8-oxo-dGTP pyrophosphatase MutT (NUDIX family)
MSESMITGGVDNGEKPIDAAVRELWEESGFSCKADELQSLGWCYGSKAMDTVYYLYCVDVTDKPQSEPVTDGGKEEAMAENYFSVSIKHCEDPLVYVCWARYCFYV